MYLHSDLPSTFRNRPAAAGFETATTLSAALSSSASHSLLARARVRGVDRDGRRLPAIVATRATDEQACCMLQHAAAWCPARTSQPKVDMSTVPT